MNLDDFAAEIHAKLCSCEHTHEKIVNVFRDAFLSKSPEEIERIKKAIDEAYRDRGRTFSAGESR